MRLSSNIIRQEVLMILAKKTFYIETMIFPLTMSLIMVLASSNRSSAALLNFIILLSIYGVLQNALSGSARSILIRLILLITGILIPLELFPRSLLLIVSLTGVPQVFNLISYGLHGEQLMDAVYWMLLPIVLVGQLAFGVYRFSTAEYNYLKTGGI